MSDILSIIGLTLLVAFLTSVVFFVQRRKLDPREPPLASSAIPLVGHLASFLYYGLEYFAIASRKNRLPAFTMDMLYTKVYIIASPELVSAVRRSRNAMSFGPLFANVAENGGGINGRGMQLLRDKEYGGQGVGQQTADSMHPALLGSGLDQMNGKMIAVLKTIIDELASQPDNVVDLYEWCSHAVTVASTDAVYGPLNPYRSESNRRAFWAIESNLSLLMMNVVPWITARKPWKGREQLTQAFIQYYQADGHLDSSQLAYTRWKVQHEAGAAIEDIARLEALTALGILSNTVPTCFYFLFDIFSRPDLLGKIRDEILDGAFSVDSAGVHTLDLADIRERCPIFVSTFQETLRTRSNSGQLRVVQKDTLLDDHLLVKAGSIILMPAAVINKHPSVWGADAGTYDPERFSKIDPAQKRSKASGFMSFGSSPHICPGRHFASGEILALVAMILVRFDVRPVRGTWVEPKGNTKAVAASLPPAVEKVEVKFSETSKFAGVKWEFRLTPGKGTFGLITG
ncbi:cytochrome P450 [Aspergillus flavus]|uniref:Cytochrome P450 n=4 Tax=Aspergillus subgen. Circumdati TaxID=2720871 RepID=D4QC90_ASPOZ|nr:cytochrome P450 [Aspergillus flavus]OOO05142.1 cytochrome P450 [Aspergillus oryzae]BAJ04438.1 cytochrome P450 monooxygenase [Aspergillus oryzae]